MMMGVWQHIAEHLESGRACVLVSVLKSRGSAPREPGTHMIVLSDGSFSGTIGGGTLEWEAIREAQRHLCETGDQPHRVVAQTMALGPSLGQCCGGTVVLGFERLEPTAQPDVRSLQELEQAGPFQCLLCLDGNGGFDRRVFSEAAGTSLSPMKEDGQFIETFGEKRRSVYLFGAGHVGQALMLALATLPFSVKWIDSRPGQFPKAVPGNFQCILSGEPQQELASADPGSLVLVMTHDHPLDLEITRAALVDGRFSYVGLIGSKTKKARFISRMLKSGLSKEQLASLVCPIGISGIRSKEPSAIAVSTAAQLLAVDETLKEGRSFRAENIISKGGWAG